MKAKQVDTWEVIRLAGDDDAIIVRSDREGVTVGHYGNKQRASLIAAAPLLLASLKEYTSWDARANVDYDTVKRAMAAIQEAEGDYREEAQPSKAS